MTVGDRLAGLHFSAQHEAGELGEVEIEELDPLLRGLLFTDGTVTRALEAHTLAPVSVEAVEQGPVLELPGPVARHLQAQDGEECLRRRVVMRIPDTPLCVWAESYLLPHRLPADFLELLGRSPHGIGGSLQQLRLESWRELLWYGLGTSPEWAGADDGERTALTRFYRVITGGQPVLLISEAFAVEKRDGLFRLLGVEDASAPDGGTASPDAG
jgi:chorismate-pyruvate lyase